MRSVRGPVIWGVLLVLVGAFLLGQNFGLIPQLGAPAWSIIFTAGSLVFLGLYVTERRAWWFLFPAFILGGLALVIFLDSRAVDSDVTGSVFLWSIALAFLATYLTDRRQWWAVIPGGVMLTVGLIPLASAYATDTGVAALLFVGIGATFLVLYLLGGRRGPTGWAIYPAVGCVIVALIVGVFGPLVKFWPLFFLILPGLWLLYTAFRGRAPSPPAPPGQK